MVCAIHDPIAPVDAKHPGFGPKTNQLLVTNTSDDGRDTFTPFCAEQLAVKTSAHMVPTAGWPIARAPARLMGDLDKNPHVKPDWDNVEFALFMGIARPVRQPL
jgi:tetrathionate reductase subunit A